MNSYTLKISEWQAVFMKYVYNGCPDHLREAVCANSGFIRSVGALRNENLIEWDKSVSGDAPDNKRYKITRKGRAALTLFYDCDFPEIVK